MERGNGKSVPETPNCEEFGEIERLKQLLAEEHRARRELAIADAGSLAIAQAIREITPIRPRVPVAKPRTKTSSHSKYEGLVHISDVHYGEVVRLESTGGLAQYNPDIAKARMEAITAEAIDIGRYMKIGKLVVGYGGDLVSGYIHDDLERSNSEMVVTQSIDMADIIVAQLEQFMQAFPVIETDFRSGNHGRPYRPMFFNQKQKQNFDYITAEMVSRSLSKQKNLKLLTNESFWNILEAGNRKFLTMHGDTIKHQNSMSLPWYSMFKELMKWMGMREQGGVPWFDDMMIGHFHNQATIQMGNSTLRVAPAVKGPDDYSYAGSRMPVPPGARFLTVSEGDVKSDHLINLEHVGGGYVREIHS